MKNKTFKEVDKSGSIDLEIKKSGLSLAIIFSKEFLSRFSLNYGDLIRLDNAVIIKKK